MEKKLKNCFSKSHVFVWNYLCWMYSTSFTTGRPSSAELWHPPLEGFVKCTIQGICLVADISGIKKPGHSFTYPKNWEKLSCYYVDMIWCCESPKTSKKNRVSLCFIPLNPRYEKVVTPKNPYDSKGQRFSSQHLDSHDMTLLLFTHQCHSRELRGLRMPPMIFKSMTSKVGEERSKRSARFAKVVEEIKRFVICTVVVLHLYLRLWPRRHKLPAWRVSPW